MTTFWGMEVKPGKGGVFVPPPEDSRLHISQATLAMGAEAGQRVGLAAKVGDETEVLLCSLREGGQESANLDIVLDRYTEFAVHGAASVHLAGYYMPMYEDEEGDEDDEDEDEEDEEEVEDFAALAPHGLSPSDFYTLARGGAMDEDDEDDDEDEDDEDDDDDEDDEDEGGLPRKSSVVITELNDGAAAGAAAAAVAAVPAIKASLREGLEMVEDEDEDDDEDDDEDNEEDDEELAAVEAQRFEEALAAAQNKRVEDKQRAAGKPKAAAADGKRKRERGAAAEAGAGAPAAKKAAVAKTTAAPAEAKPEKAAVGKAKKEAGKAKGAKQDAGAPAAANGKPGKASRVRTFANGFAIEDLAFGQASGKLAKPGKKVVVRYKGTHKGKVFDETKGKATFSFCLGVGEVIKGWDRGVEGMRVGDKRRLTIPPQMAYGTGGAKPAIPPNATLNFVVELVDVK